jgi:hypothetical protein
MDGLMTGEGAASASLNPLLQTLPVHRQRTNRHLFPFPEAAWPRSVIAIALLILAIGRVSALGRAGMWIRPQRWQRGQRARCGHGRDSLSPAVRSSWRYDNTVDSEKVYKCYRTSQKVHSVIVDHDRTNQRVVDTEDIWRQYFLEVVETRDKDANDAHPETAHVDR